MHYIQPGFKTKPGFPISGPLFQDGGEGLAANKKPLSSENAKEDNGGSWTGATIPNTNGTTANAALTTSSLYFPRSGYVRNDNRSYVPGYDSFYWSSSADASVYAFSLNFNGAALHPSLIYYRFNGYPLRCLHQS